MDVWVPIIFFIGVPLAIVAAVVYALVRIRKRREKDHVQTSLAGDGVDPKVNKFFKAVSKRYAGLTGWAWLLAGFAIYEVWTEVSTLKSGGGSIDAALAAIIFAVVIGVVVFRDWLKPRRLSRVWRVLSITGVALVCSVGALWLTIPMLEWGSCISGDCQSGHGTFNYVSGDTYEGEWRNGIPGPRGSYKFSNGETYVGEWREGAPVGQGTTTWPNGDVYVGEHGGGYAWGTGTKTYADGRVESGRWKYGRLVEPE
jgi:hypothetical protein